MLTSKFLKFITVPLLILLSFPSFALSPISISSGVFDLHRIIFWVCISTIFLVFGVLLFTLLKHRRAKEQKQADFHSSVFVEMVWSLIPVVILIIMIAPASMLMMHLYPVGKGNAEVKTVANQKSTMGKIR